MNDRTGYFYQIDRRNRTRLFRDLLEILGIWDYWLKSTIMHGGNRFVAAWK